MAHRIDFTRRKRGLAAALEATGLSLATAESCTGGQLAALLAGDVKLGPHLERGFVVYSKAAKCELLDVSVEAAERDDAVNAEAAEAMAKGALMYSHADLTIAITGFCGPQQDAEEVGLVHLACAVRGGSVMRQECHFGDIGREQVLDHAVAAALDLLMSATRAGKALASPACAS
ncbi:CinA family protein [Sphingopyxis sp.]|uniref:CinA family protein n=1 Tax=Sphingopyxis sp. TaxID=1908224 RepID=UPI002D798388|nr:CinA family protein [Sphingopyxis sp.]HET6526878.1 CinA family protein [Sphingopyxis sp.]